MSKTVTLTKDPISYKTLEVDIPKGVYKEKTYDYQDKEPYYKYYYKNKNGNKKECKIKWI